MDWTALFCEVDDFCQQVEPLWRSRQLESGKRRRNRQGRLANSEMMTILIAFHASHYRNFKHFYHMLRQQHRAEFPGLVGYGRFVERMPQVLGLLSAYLRRRFGRSTGIAFIDSTAVAVCGNKRITRNRVFAGIAARGRTTLGWFYGFKLHLVINQHGELLGCHLTPGSVDDRQPVPTLARRLSGKLFGDKGYLSAKLFDELCKRGIHLVTQVRRNMPNKLLPLIDKILLRKRALIETVNDQLKNIAHIEHTRHRSPVNFMVNLLAGLICYTHQPKKPTIRMTQYEQNLLQQLPLTMNA